MKTYKIRVRETVVYIGEVIVEAEDATEAIAKARKLWQDDEFHEQCLREDQRDGGEVYEIERYTGTPQPGARPELVIGFEERTVPLLEDLPGAHRRITEPIV